MQLLRVETIGLKEVEQQVIICHNITNEPEKLMNETAKLDQIVTKSFKAFVDQFVKSQSDKTLMFQM